MPKQLIAIYLSTLLAGAILGAFVLLQDKKSKSNLSFFGITFFEVLWILSLYFGYFNVFKRPPDLVQSEFFIEFAYGAGLITLMMLNIFLYYFPRKSFELGRIKFLSYVTLTIIIAVIASFTDLVHDQQIIENGVYVADTFGPLYNIYSIFLLLSLLLATYIATKKSLHLKGLEKVKIGYTAVGCWLLALTVIATNIVLPLYGIYHIGDVGLVQISPAYTLLFIIPSSYSIYKHRFFNFSTVYFRIFRSLLFYAVFLGFTYSFYIVVLNIAPQINIFLQFGISAVVAYALMGKVATILPEFASEGMKELRKQVQELNTLMLSRGSLGELQGAIEKTFKVNLNFVNSTLYVVREKEEKKFEVPIFTPDTLTKAMETCKNDAFIAEEVRYEKLSNNAKKRIQACMRKIEADICMPLFSEGNLIGFLALQRKSKSGRYAKEEIKEILGVQRGLEIALMNQLLKLNLQEENNLMKSIINKKTRQLKKKIAEVNELLKQQADFIAVTAHEFRTPLSIATFQIEDILSSKKKPAEQLKDLKVVEGSIANVKALTEKLFAVQQYDLNKVDVKLENISITDFINQTFKDFTPIMKQKKIKFELGMKTKKNLKARIDQAQFRQLLHNLLNNASKFTPKDGKIKLSLAEVKGKINIRIEDNGAGIPDDMKKSIFEKFRTKNAGHGIGLGLYLCKKIAELHKGKLWVEDSKLGGAAFVIEMKKLAK